MTGKPLSWVIAIDGGTTNTRAKLLRDGEVIATARRPVGVRDTVLSANSRSVFRATRECLAEVLATAGLDRPDAIVASGMLSSEVGLATVPHVVAPAGLDELADGSRELDLPEASDRPILFVPGVRTTASTGADGWATADLMRGEECETMGALAAARIQGPVAFLWPGSHSKLVEVDGEGRIVRSATSIAGEITAAVARHTLIAASLPESLPDEPDSESAAAGLRLGSSEGLGRAAFLIRLAAVSGSMSPAERGAFWVGAVVGDDASHLARHRILNRGLPLWIGGREPLRGLYRTALENATGGTVSALPEGVAVDAAALGALGVALRRAERRGRSD